MAQTNYVLTQATNSAGESQIHLRLYISRNIRLRIGSGIWIDRKRWGKKNDINITLIPGEEREALLEKRAKLKALTDLFEAEINSCTDKNTLTREWAEKQVRKFHQPVKVQKERVQNFFSIMEDYLSRHKLSESRKKHFRVIMRCLKRYELYRQTTCNHTFKLNINTLSYDQLADIENFLANEHEVFKAYPKIYDIVPYSTKEAKKIPKRKPKEDGEESKFGMPKARGQNYVSDIMTRFRSFIIWANNNDIIANNPFKTYSVGESVYGTPIYISNEERRQLYEADLSDNPLLAAQRDIFVFQCLIGCRVSDLYKFTRNNIINGAMEYIQKKTKEDRPITIRVPLNSTAQEIIARYSDPRCGSLLPYISEQKYNVKIKEAFKCAGLERMVTTIDQRTRQEVQRPLYEIASSHMARRSFIGNIYKQVKDPNLVGALSGHKEGSKAFARYRTIDDDMKKELIDMLG